jgi:hypothetical protein
VRYTLRPCNVTSVISQHCDIIGYTTPIVLDADSRASDTETTNIRIKVPIKQQTRCFEVATNNPSRVQSFKTAYISVDEVLPVIVRELLGIVDMLHGSHVCCFSSASLSSKCFKRASACTRLSSNSQIRLSFSKPSALSRWSSASRPLGILRESTLVSRRLRLARPEQPVVAVLESSASSVSGR